MANRSGLEFVRSVRKMGYPGRIVVMAGRLDLETMRAYHEHASSGFFSKPFAASMLATMLRQE
jgi:FixJ family two-component response regulator